MAAPASDDGQDLCLACGLCCQAVWFSHVTVDPEQVERAREAGFPVEIEAGEAKFQQPCMFHRDNRCTIYSSWRPTPCHAYRCKLLESYVANEMSFNEAVARVEESRAYAQRIRAEVGSIEGGLRGAVFLARLHREPDAQGRIPPPLSAQTQMDAVALAFLYRKYFHRDQDLQ